MRVVGRRGPRAPVDDDAVVYIIVRESVCLCVQSGGEGRGRHLSLADATVAECSVKNVNHSFQVRRRITITSHHRHTHTHTHTRLTALCPGLPGWAGTRKVKPIWILLKQETVSGSGISWATCKSAPRSRQNYTIRRTPLTTAPRRQPCVSVTVYVQ